jgi:hypothetical protein
MSEPASIAGADYELVMVGQGCPDRPYEHQIDVDRYIIVCPN